MKRSLRVIFIVCLSILVCIPSIQSSDVFETRVQWQEEQTSSNTPPQNGIFMKPITMAEEFYSSSTWSQYIVAAYYPFLYPDDNGLVEYIGMPSQKYYNKENDGSLPENDIRFRQKLYDTEYMPRFSINGKIHAPNEENVSPIAGFKLIRDGIQSKKQYADFWISPSFDLIQIVGTHDALENYQNVHLNVIVVKRNVNCTDQGDDFCTTILHQIAVDYPMGALGEKIQITNNVRIEKELLLEIPDTEREMCGLVAFLQDMDSKEIVAASHADFSSKPPTLFSIDHLPPCTLEKVDQIGKFSTGVLPFHVLQNNPLYHEPMGLREKVISVENAQSLHAIDATLDYTDFESSIYSVLGAALTKEMENKATFHYDPTTHRVIISFHEPLQGNHDIFRFFVKIHASSLRGISYRGDPSMKVYDTNFKWKSFSATDTNHCLVNYSLREQRTLFPVRMVTVENPFDFNNDTWIDEEDIQLFLPSFGSRQGDPQFSKKYDIYPTVNKEGLRGDGKIDFLDLYYLVIEVKQQDALAQEILHICEGLDWRPWYNLFF